MSNVSPDQARHIAHFLQASRLHFDLPARRRYACLPATHAGREPDRQSPAVSHDDRPGRATYAQPEGGSARHGVAHQRARAIDDQGEAGTVEP